MIDRLWLKVALPSALVVMLATLAITAAITGYGRDRETALAQERGRSLGKLAAVTLDLLRTVTPAGHRPDLRPFLDELKKSPDIAAVRVLSPDSKAAHSPMAGHVVQPIWNSPQCHSCHGSGPLLGYLDLEIGARRQADISLWSVLGTVSGGSELLGLLLLTGVVAAVLVSRPVRRLARAMERVRNGELDVRVAPVGAREIDVVIGGFNTMMERLREAARKEDEARRLQMARAEQLATVGEMAAGLAHEIRNPVAGVKAAVEVLASQLGTGDPQRAILQESADELDRVDEVIKSLLDFARPRPPALKTADLTTLVREAAMLTAAQAAVERVAILFDNDPLPKVVVDPAMVRQVIVNLILNAVQAIAGCEGGRIILSTHVADGQVLCRVSDNGPGVTEADAETIFKPFFTSKPRGTGLGLSISRRLIELHGGHLWLENPGHPGACFVLSVPIAGAGSPIPVGPGDRPRDDVELT